MQDKDNSEVPRFSYALQSCTKNVEHCCPVDCFASVEK